MYFEVFLLFIEINIKSLKMHSFNSLDKSYAIIHWCLSVVLWSDFFFVIEKS